jgi:hypothetical protein
MYNDDFDDDFEEDEMWCGNTWYHFGHLWRDYYGMDWWCAG